MSEQPSNEDIVWRWANAFNARDAEAVGAMCHPEARTYPLLVAVTGHVRDGQIAGMRSYLSDEQALERLGLRD